MKRFVFRLQLVLDRALQEEEEQLQVLGRLRAEKYHVEQRMVAKVDERKCVMTVIGGLQQQLFDPCEVHDCHLRMEALANDLAALRVELEEIDQRIARQQQVVIEAMRKRKMLERLREKQFEVYQKEVAKQEFNMMEEVTLPRLSRERALEEARRQAAQVSQG